MTGSGSPPKDFEDDRKIVAEPRNDPKIMKPTQPVIASPERTKQSTKDSQQVEKPKVIGASSVATMTTESLALNEIEFAWPRVIEYVKTKRMSTGIFLSESGPVEVEGDTVVLGLPAEFQFHKETLEKNSNFALV